MADGKSNQLTHREPRIHRQRARETAPQKSGSSHDHHGQGGLDQQETGMEARPASWPEPLAQPKPGGGQRRRQADQ